MRVRDATPDDAMPVFALHVAATRRVSSCHFTDEQLRDWANKRGDGPERYDTDDLLVAERDGDVVGFGGWREADADDSNVDADEVAGETAELAACYVHPDHARSGVGSALVERMHDEMREELFERAKLTASLNAVEFYERHGYDDVEHFTITPGDVEFPVVRMARDL